MSTNESVEKFHTPAEIVELLNKHIIGQNDAKRAVAIALRNRWRWRQLNAELRQEITPKNMIMIGPTGVGKTEITRRLATILGCPFIKVEATKYTEVGYYGRDVESMVRDLVEEAIRIIKKEKKEEVKEQAAMNAEENILDLLLPDPDYENNPHDTESPRERHSRNREKFREMLRAGSMEERKITINTEVKGGKVQVFPNMGMDFDIQNMFEKIIPKQTKTREVTVREARDIFIEEEIENLLDTDSVNDEGLELAENSGMIFIDEIDKICGSDEAKSADVSRQGVQRDLLPIVEGTTVQTKYGNLRTDNILFIAAGAFHRNRPSDLMPELQGRFPIRVELSDLNRDDFVRILKEPALSLPMQYQELLAVEQVTLRFEEKGLELIASLAFDMNQSSQNIGARRLHTIMEKLLEEISYTAPDHTGKTILVDEAYVKERLQEFLTADDHTKFIL